jgi:hypothetical protein
MLKKGEVLLNNFFEKDWKDMFLQIRNIIKKKKRM